MSVGGSDDAREKTEHPSRFSLLLWQAGDLPTTEAERVAAHVSQCETCSQTLREVEQDSVTYREDLPTHLSTLRARLASERSQSARPRQAPLLAGLREMLRRPWFAPLVGAAALGAIGLVVISGDGNQPAGTRQPSVAYKGAFAVQAIARRDGEQWFVGPGQMLYPGDGLRFVVTSDQPGFLTLFSFDGEQRLSRLYPDQQQAAPMRLEQAGRHELPGSAVLDDVLGEERFVWVFSPQPFECNEVYERARVALSEANDAVLSASDLGLQDAEVGWLNVIKRPRP